MKINHLTESKLPGAFKGVKVMSPEEFVAQSGDAKKDVFRPERFADVQFETEVAEDKPQRDTNRLWQMITDYERRAKMSSSDIRKQHYMKMADELRAKLPTNEGEVVAFPKKHKGDLEDTHDCPKCGGDLQGGTYMGHKVKVCMPCKQVYLPPNSGIDKNGNKIDEATVLPAQQRELGGQEFQDYMKRIQGTPDIDKKTGKVKVGKDRISKKTGEVIPGEEKYISGKTKGDKFKMPYMHRSSVITYYDTEGKRYREEDVIKALQQRPKKLLKQNEKMKHSNGAFEQFFNVGFAALTGVAVDESTGKLIIVNTCPGAGSCKVDCFAMKGGKVQFKNAWISDGRILTYLLNDPTGFFNQLSNEIAAEEKAGQKGDKKFPNGWNVTIRWHDAGDFFSPEYLDLALKMAAKHPNTKFYAYTKMAGAALANKPDNFIINWSEGAHTSQEKQVKAADPNLEQTKNSRIVPDNLFQDLLVKDQKGNLVKGAAGQWQVQPDKLPELKQRLAQAYKISPSSILSYDEYTSKPKVAGMKYNVIVAPGEGDISANDTNVLSTLLLRH